MASERSTRKRETGRSPVRVNRTVSAQPLPHDALPHVAVPKPFQGFINFVREQGVVGLGVGFVIGTSSTTLVKSFVANLVTPLIGLLTGGIDFSKKTVCLNSAAGVCKNTLNYGQVISDFITFFVILAIVYLVVKRLKLESLDKHKEDK